MATHSCVLTRRIPWTKEPGWLQSMGSQRVWHNWVTNTSLSHDLPQKKPLRKGWKKCFGSPSSPPPLFNSLWCSHSETIHSSLVGCFSRRHKRKNEAAFEIEWNLPHWGSITISCQQSLASRAAAVPAPHPWGAAPPGEWNPQGGRGWQTAKHLFGTLSLV